MGDKTEVRVVVVGDHGTGKSSLIDALVNDAFSQEVPHVLPITCLPHDFYPDRIPVTIVDTSASLEKRDKLEQELKLADAVVLTYACDQQVTLDQLTTFWLPQLRKLEVKVPVIVVGCKVDAKEDTQISLQQIMSPIMQQFREIETCIECSARHLVQVPEVFHYAQKAVIHPTAPLFDLETQTLKPLCISALKQIFFHCDRDKDGALSDAEFNDFQVKCFDAPLQPSEIEGVKRAVQERLAEGVNVNGLTLPGFLSLHTLFMEKARLETTWTVLRKFGYDNGVKLRDDFIPVSFKRAPDQVMENRKTSKANLQSLQLESESLKRIMEGMDKEGDQQIHTLLENVKSSEQHLKEIGNEVDQIKGGLLENTTSVRLQLSSKVTECVKVVKALKERAVEMFLHGVARDELKRFTSDDINRFTSDLSKEIGAGGFSVVYEGEFPDNVQIAVKVLKQNHLIEEIFMAEVGTILKATHRSLIKLYGFCFDGCMKALVYEFMENGSLDVVLLQKPCLVEWETLYGMAIEIARALAYLHHECDGQIIHHDIKPSNILLDAKFCPRVTDFGTARMMRSDLSHFTMISMRGTCGYIAPEMFLPTSRVTYKCDVYSFGKMLLDVLGINRDKHEGLWYKLENGGLDESLKQCGIMEKDTKRAKILSLVAYWCIQFSADIRPSMKDVVDALEEKMQVGKPPNPFLPCSGNYSMQQSEDVHRIVTEKLNALKISEADITSVESSGEFFDELKRNTPKQFSPKDLTKFTSGFADIACKGGFGTVYKGEFDDGVKIAVKVLEENGLVPKSFKAEVSTMFNTSHRNIVKFYGYCFDHNMKAIVYEYMENGSLDAVLYGNPFKLEWRKFYEISVETAKGLSYLHHECDHQILHQDLKPGNILLDKTFSAKITDFGLARLIDKDLTHITWTNYGGTRDYMAPEIFMQSSKITSKCDVYSFGMILFEVLRRKRNNNDADSVWFPKKVWLKFHNGELEQLLDDCGIGEEEDRARAKILCMVALWCSQFESEARPTMSEVVMTLERKIPIKNPPNPWFF